MNDSGKYKTFKNYAGVIISVYKGLLITSCIIELNLKSMRLCVTVKVW